MQEVPFTYDIMMFNKCTNVSPYVICSLKEQNIAKYISLSDVKDKNIELSCCVASLLMEDQTLPKNITSTLL